MDKNNDKKASHTFQAEGEYTANEIKKDLLRLENVLGFFVDGYA